MNKYHLTHLKELEAESIFIISSNAMFDMFGLSLGIFVNSRLMRCFEC